MRPIAIVAAAERVEPEPTTLTSVELIAPVIAEALQRAALERHEVQFWCHGSADYMSGQPFSFVAAVDAIGAWPPIVESHVEGDGAMALYEAWVKLAAGEANTAVVFANGKTTAGPTDRILTTQLDPYLVAPLWPGATAIAALQARACLEAGVVSAVAMAEVAAALTGRRVDELLAEPMVCDPLRAHDIAPPRDAAVAVVLAAGDAATRLSDRPAWIRGLDHRIARQRLDSAAMTAAPSAAEAGRRAGVGASAVDVAELYDPYTHQHCLVRDALGLDPVRTRINPSGGALAANAQMASGLARFAHAAWAIQRGEAGRAVAHSTSGPCLQQNLVGVLAVDRG